ncbi:MAG TPA: hypothetical protein VGJ47_04965 [Gemmatimonadaceae bacterium]
MTQLPEGGGMSSEEHPEPSLMYVSAAALTYIRRVTALLRRGHSSD